ncbi:MAG TPA: GNAT family N-acetyltransferase [Saprospiraceae bacterium]|nr:GNAT family N-acetyltransferase [Saprospiraceae bacterium]
MTVRAATEQDIPQIIGLLKKSLGESLLPKSEAFWRWKHLDNPFGASPVIAAEDEGRLIGLRAFMRWQWQRDGQQYSALRAVDTATHPDYQGRGIFKKLTLQLLKDCKNDGDHFIFNTPNEKSKPGYLKMGWSEVGKIPVRLKPERPVRLILNKFFPKNPATGERLDLQDFKIERFFKNTSGLSWLDDTPLIPGKIYTRKTSAFLKWRYADCPVRTYSAAGGDNFLIIFYLKNHHIGKELRIVEAFGKNAKPIGQAFKMIKKQLKPDFISIAPPADARVKSVLDKLWFLPPRNIGPVLTFKSLNVAEKDFLDIERWAYSLGDFELF